MTLAPRPPRREEVAAWFAALLTGTRTRDEADRWAAQWHGGPDDAAVDDEVIWWALGLLHGVDMPASPDGTFLHDDDQVRQWFAEFRHRCATSPSGEVPSHW